MANKLKERNFFYFFLLAISLFCALLFWPFIVIIIISASFAIVLDPIFQWISTHITKRRTGLASILTILVFLVVIGVPLALIGARVFSESQDVYSSLKNGGASKTVDTVSSFIQTYIPEAATFDIRSKLSDIVAFLSGSIVTVFTTTLNTILSGLLGLLALFYFLKDGEQIKTYLTDLLPLSLKHDKQILSRLSKAVNGIMKGYVLIALVQGILTGLGLWVFGVPSAALWGVLAGIASMIPSIGTAMISLPAIAYLLFTGHSLAALGLGIWSVALVGSIDNVLNPIVVGKQIELHPLIILFAVLGGIALMGAAGIIIGPLAASLLYTLICIYQEDFQQTT